MVSYFSNDTTYRNILNLISKMLKKSQSQKRLKSSTISHMKSTISTNMKKKKI